MKTNICLFHFLIFFQLLFSQEGRGDGQWHTITGTTVAIARHECSFIGIEDTFYLVGGRGIKPVSIYNTETNTWTEGKEPPTEIHHFQAVAHEGHIYVFGAMSGKFPYEKPLKNILIYNPIEDEWKIGSEIPEDRRRGSTGVIVKNNKAYVISGIVDGHNSTHVPWVDSYDFETDSWQILADAPRPRDHFHAAYQNGKIYAAGGRNSSYATNQIFDLTIPEVDIYDIESNTWCTLSNKNTIPTMRAGTSVAFIENDLIVIGGESMAQDNAHNTVEAFNIESNTWRKLASLNVGRHGSQAIVHKNEIYIVAGSGKRGGKPELASMEVFQTTKN
jgi:N-acetylneuraminic acid mutarotase